ncbi:MAG: hypothetical protein KatS3mg102_1751 [Planctomycetota bacterium]|nr:MAG: hypothetical protein KatS3mg102_1751 [Planctomycetota bacterium]
MRVTGRLLRTFVELAGKQLEVNVWGEGERDGKAVRIVGEAKTQMTRRDIDRFYKKVELLHRHRGEDLFVVLLARMARPEVEQYGRERGAAFYYSYDL